MGNTFTLSLLPPVRKPKYDSSTISRGVFLIFLYALTTLSLWAQAPAIQWDRTIGGHERDFLGAIKQTMDGGYILGGDSYSNRSGDKSQNRVPGEPYYARDFWIVKVDANGTKVWDKTFGGSHYEFFGTVEQLSDGGYILAGQSESSLGFDKTENSKGGSDFWIVRIDANGNKIWDKTIGSTTADVFGHLQPTADGGFIVGGSTSGSIGGDKSENSKGDRDFWIVKLDASGNKVWDKTIGGSGSDGLSTIQLTSDGGYLLGGASSSSISGDKSENSKGDSDFWIVKLDASGNKVWDKTIGGSTWDDLRNLKQNSDGSYTLIGISRSPAGGDKSAPLKGRLPMFDFWIVKLDESLNKLWDKAISTTYGISSIVSTPTNDGGLVIGTGVDAGIDVDKTEASKGMTDYWIVRLDANGNILWDKTLGGTSVDNLTSLQQTADGGYIIGGSSGSPISFEKSENSKGSFDYWIIKMAPETPPTQKTPISAGNAHSLFLSYECPTGTPPLKAVGLNLSGQLGDGTTTSRSTPVQVSGLTGISAVAGGGQHSLFLKGDGTVWAVGHNELGQFGNGTTTGSHTPVQVPGLTGVKAIAAGFYHSLFLKNDGTVWATGANYYGQLGDGTTTDRSTPVQVPGLTGIKAIAAGVNHSLFLKSDGTVLAVGFNIFGQLGDGTTTDRLTPVQVSGLTGIKALSGGSLHSLFLKDDGTAWAVGINQQGQLGIGTTALVRTTPVQVQFSGPTLVTAVSAGDQHSLFLKDDGTVMACGYNNMGQLGDGTTTSKISPVQVSGLTGVTAISGGSSHSLFLKSDGTIWAVGDNQYGQLGDGTTTNRTTPVPALMCDMAPQISCPDNIIRNNDANQCGAWVNFAATALGVPAPTVTYSTLAGSIVPGSFFPVGTTTVTATATNTVGSTSCTFTVTVNDTQQPTLSCPADINVTATSVAGAVVNYTTPVGNDNCPGVGTTRMAGQATGTTFPIGTTTVTYRATDATGNFLECSFLVIVENPIPTITLGNIPPICQGTASFQIPYTATTHTPDQYTVTGTGVSANQTGNLNGSSGTITVGIDPVTFTGNFTLIVSNSSTGISSSPVAGVVGINPLPVVSAGDCKTIYLGYGPSCATLTATGNAQSYAWTGGLTGASVQVCPTTTTPYTVTATSAAGCTSTASVTVEVLDIREIRNNGRVEIWMCDGSRSETRRVEDVARQLEKGWTLGRCGQVPCTGAPVPIAVQVADCHFIYKGYGATCVTLSATATGGYGELRYNWGEGLNGSSVQVCPEKNTNYTLTVTDQHGYVATRRVEVEVLDVYCGKGTSNMELCHEGKSICVPVGEVAAHLAHGDKLGKCNDKPCRGSNASRQGIEEFGELPVELLVEAYPNPTGGQVTLMVRTSVRGMGLLEVLDLTGRIMQEREVEWQAGDNTLSLEVGSHPSGIYIVRARDAVGRQGAVRIVRK